MDEFLRVINKCLPNLEYLSIEYLNSTLEPVQLDHVKYFSVTIPGVQCPFDQLSIPNLESLSLPYYQQNDGKIIARDTWINFFKNHQNLREINCTAHTNEELPEFLAELPNLTKIRLTSYDNFGIDFVSGLIENHKSLLYLQYEVITQERPEVSDLENYLKKYGNKWHGTHHVSESGLIYKFQRKIEHF